MVKKVFYLINCIMAIATLIVIALAIVNSISPFRAFFGAKPSATGYVVVTHPAYESDEPMKR